MTVRPLFKEHTILDDHKGYDVTMFASIDDNNRTFEHFTIYDHTTGDMLTGFDTLQKCIDWIEI